MSANLQFVNAERNLNILIKGLKNGNLNEALNGAGTFTITAPVNFTFGKLNSGELFDDLIKDGNKTNLSGIITYQIISGKYPRITDFNIPVQ
jgi:uncharacterized surface protein with fasciclin (FAS1) repeats